MPNIITHKLFAERVFENLNKHDIRSIIEKYPQIYYIGSNGPDFLFFYHAKPWESYKKHTLNRLGSQMHSSHINEFYETALQCIQNQTRQDVKEMMMSYLFGHLCHWALDKTTHPYIFHKTGDCKGKSAAMHHRFESMMDTLMLEKLKGMDIKDYPAYKICEYDEDILRAIARIYVPVAKAVYHQEIKVFALREALNSWYDIQKMLHDPRNIKFSILQGVERVVRKPYAISGNIVKCRAEEQYDILNEEKGSWVHPCDEHISSTASFLELFEEASIVAQHVIEKAYGCLEYNSDVQNVMDILQNQAYDTGMDGEKTFQFFDVIYE